MHIIPRILALRRGPTSGRRRRSKRRAARAPTQLGHIASAAATRQRTTAATHDVDVVVVAQVPALEIRVGKHLRITATTVAAARGIGRGVAMRRDVVLRTDLRQTLLMLLAALLKGTHGRIEVSGRMRAAAKKKPDRS